LLVPTSYFPLFPPPPRPTLSLSPCTHLSSCTSRYVVCAFFLVRVGGGEEKTSGSHVNFFTISSPYSQHFLTPITTNIDTTTLVPPHYTNRWGIPTLLFCLTYSCGKLPSLVPRLIKPVLQSIFTCLRRSTATCFKAKPATI